MHKSKGKWRFSAKDTYSVTNLDTIVLAYLEKLHECIKKSKNHGVPMYYVEKQAKIQGLDNLYSEEVDIDAADELRLRDLEELIWTFQNNEPDIMKYDFEIKFEQDPETMYFKTEVSNVAEHQRYNEDEKAYWERKKAGYKLAGEIWQYLDW